MSTFADPVADAELLYLLACGCLYGGEFASAGPCLFY